MTIKNLFFVPWQHEEEKQLKEERELESARRKQTKAWEMLTDEETGDDYFHHMPTGLTTWEQPECWTPRTHVSDQDTDLLLVRTVGIITDASTGMQ